MSTPVRFRRYAIAAVVVGMATVGTHQLTAQASGSSANHGKQKMTFKSGNLTLTGYSYKPAGSGPFPLVIWNHGSEPDPAGGPQFDSVAAVFVPAGYAVFAPIRRGQSESQGEYVQNRIKATVASQGLPTAARLMVRLMESEQLDDQLAGLAYAKTLKWVDSTKTVVAGCSYGGIETLLAAERGAGFKAALSISPAALSWASAPPLQDRLKQAVRRIEIPVLLIQPPKDASLEPARVLGDGRRPARGKVRDSMPRSTQRRCPTANKCTASAARKACTIGGAKRWGSLIVLCLATK